MKYLIGIDVGTHGLRACLFSTEGEKITEAAVNYDTKMPKDGWVEQEPLDWWQAALTALKRIGKDSGVNTDEIIAISYACTSCTVVVLDEHGEPLRPAMLWMDERAYEEARMITSTHHPQLKYGGGEVSPQWMLPKGLWLSKHEPEIFKKAYRIVEQTDYFSYKLAGRWTISKNNATSKWCYVSLIGGWDSEFIELINAQELASKWPQEILKVGEVIGKIQGKVAEETGLSPNTLIVQGGIDAHGGMVGLSGTHDGDLSMVLGTSTCLMAQSIEPIFANIWGPFPDSLIEGQYTIGGGQSTSGAIIDWLIDLFPNNGGDKSKIYEMLNFEASKIPPGSCGLVALDYFQGNRNPYKNPRVRGAIWGLSLRHTLPHLYRAFCESVAYGVRQIIEDLNKHELYPNRILAGGGGANSPLWMQIHADCTGLPITIALEKENTALGAAIWAGLGAGEFSDYDVAINRMVRLGSTFEPNMGNKLVYDFYYKQYVSTYFALKEQMLEVVSYEEARNLN